MAKQFVEVIDKVLKETTTKALGQQNKTCGQPKIDLKSFGEGKDLRVYNYLLQSSRKLNIKSFENITFDEYEIKIDDNEANKRIDQIAKTQNKFKDTDDKYVANEGDLILSIMRLQLMVIVQSNVGKGTQIVLGKDLFIKGFDKSIIKIKKK